MKELFYKVIPFFDDMVANTFIEIHKGSSYSKEMELTNRLLKRYQKKILDKTGISWDDNQIKLLELTSCSLKWKNLSSLKNKKEILYGGTTFSISKGLLADQDERLQDNPLNHPQDLVDNLYSFNDSEIELYTPQNGMGCFYREHGKWPLDIYFFDAGVRIKMNLSLDEYIQAMIDSCAVAYWQYFYVDVEELVQQNAKMILRNGTLINNLIQDKDLDSPRLPYLLYELDVFVRNLPDLFPDKDFSYHQSRLAQIKEHAQSYL